VQFNLENPDRIVFHFNKKHNEDQSIPPWILKIKGQTYYVSEVEFRNVSFSTKQTPDNDHTKGSLLYKNCYCKIEDGKAIVSGDKIE
jgi:hypothetical protein